MTRVEGFKILWDETNKDRNSFDNAVTVIVEMDRQRLLAECQTEADFDSAFWNANLPEPHSKPDPEVNDQRTELLTELAAAAIHRPSADHN